MFIGRILQLSGQSRHGYRIYFSSSVFVRLAESNDCDQTSNRSKMALCACRICATIDGKLTVSVVILGSRALRTSRKYCIPAFLVMVSRTLEMKPRDIWSSGNNRNGIYVHTWRQCHDSLPLFRSSSLKQVSCSGSNLATLSSLRLSTPTPFMVASLCLTKNWMRSSFGLFSDN